MLMAACVDLGRFGAARTAEPAHSARFPRPAQCLDNRRIDHLQRGIACAAAGERLQDDIRGEATVLQEGVGNHGHQCVTMKTLPGSRLDVPLSSGWLLVHQFLLHIERDMFDHYEFK
jgi:hypothetical protein